MTLIQFLAVGLVILILIKTIADFKKNKITLAYFLFWMGLWLVILIVAVLPQITGFFAKLLGVGRGVDVAIYFAIIFIFFILFEIITRLEKIKQEITEIVRHLALKNPKKK